MNLRHSEEGKMFHEWRQHFNCPWLWTCFQCGVFPDVTSLSQAVLSDFTVILLHPQGRGNVHLPNQNPIQVPGHFKIKSLTQNFLQGLTPLSFFCFTSFKSLFLCSFIMIFSDLSLLCLQLIWPTFLRTTFY